jgi:hypothetical protein
MLVTLAHLDTSDDSHVCLLEVNGLLHKVLNVLQVGETGRQPNSPHIEACDTNRGMDEQSRAEQSRAEQSRAEQSRAGSTGLNERYNQRLQA